MGRSRKFRPPSVGPSYELRFDSADSRFACVGRSIVIWDMASRTRLNKLHPFKHPSHVDWSPRGDQIVVKSTSGRLVIVDPSDASGEVRWLRKRGKEGCEVAFSACGDFLVDCNWDGRLDVFNIRTGEISLSESINHAMITSLAYSRSRTWFAYVVCPKATANGFPANADYLVLRKWPFWDHQPVVVPTESHDIEAIAFSPTEQHIVLAGSGPGHEAARLKVVDLESGTVVAQTGYSLYASAKSIAWCQHANLIGNVEQSGVRLYDATELRALAFLPLEYPSQVEFSRSGSHIGVGAWGKGFVCQVEEALASGMTDA